jgi:ribosome-associated translation inhibitor RaiA/cold shock CspA family protein
MILPLQITFRNMDSSEPVERIISEEVAKLETFYSRVISCRVMVEMPEHHHKAGSLYHIRIDMKVPHGELVVEREPGLHGTAQDIDEEKATKHLEAHAPHKDLFLAIRDAFQKAGRRLQDYARRQRGDTKIHAPASAGRVTRLVPDENCGFLATPDQREVYFHRNAVLHGAFDRLKVRDEVRFAEEMGEQGPQASSVRLVRKHLAA